MSKYCAIYLFWRKSICKSHSHAKLIYLRLFWSVYYSSLIICAVGPDQLSTRLDRNLLAAFIANKLRHNIEPLKKKLLHRRIWIHRSLPNPKYAHGGQSIIHTKQRMFFRWFTSRKTWIHVSFSSEGPKRRPEGGEWEPIKKISQLEARPMIPSVHPTLDS